MTGWRIETRRIEPDGPCGRSGPPINRVPKRRLILSGEIERDACERRQLWTSRGTLGVVASHDAPNVRVGQEKQCVAKKIANTWYVAISIPGKKEKAGNYSRRSRTFASETDAKLYAVAKIAEGVELSAGTLNPVVPKRTIGPLQIEQWLSE
jgi:hypothetical protein